MKILFASPEVFPYAKTGGLADVSGSLPKALTDIGCELTVALPFYKCVRELGLPLAPFKIGKFNFLKHKKNNIEFIFVVEDAYYNRDNLYTEEGADYPDNDLRFSHFSKGVVELAGSLQKTPDVIHCNDWQTGLVPLYLRIKKVNIKTLFTIHNIGYQGLFGKDSLARIRIPRSYYHIDGIEYYQKVSFLKAGIVFSTAINTVSKKYSEEILTPEFGCGMDGILRTRAGNVYGILNGVDYSQWDPRVDRFIICNYDSKSLDKKFECKKDLMKQTNLLPKLDRPLIGVISRLAEQKGIDLIVEAAKDMLNMGSSLVILGTGDEKYNTLCSDIAKEYPEYISSNITFSDELAHKIEAGCDMFVMPSRYEPCGLNQLYSLRYGTLPIVRATGGLDDTVIDIYGDRENGNGIKFVRAEREDFVDAVSRAISVYKDKERWNAIISRIMNLDFSWKTSALSYKKLYEKIMK